MVHPLEAPIPGQSLTSQPKNVPWEYPARITEPMDALEFHMKQLTDENTVDNIMEMLEVGIPVSVIASSMLTVAVMDGEHSIDVKLIIKPFVEDHIKSLAEVTGIDYKMSMRDYDDTTEADKQRKASVLEAKIRNMTEKVQPSTMDEGDRITEQAQQELMKTEEPETEAMPTEPKGLMSKENM
tara:strand:+ start:189 stop:737 length:549 start_codon:yes stop_codon:yes gene_type:complete